MVESVSNQIDGNPGSTSASMPTLSRYIWHGALGFCGVSLLVFATVAFAERWLVQTLGLAGAYALWALLFTLLGATVYAPLMITRKRRFRFYLLFSIAFVLYAVGWTGAYFLLRGKLGEWLGSLAGTILMAVVFAAGFSAWRVLLKLIVVLFLANSIGYFIGEALNNLLSGKVGMLAWGAVFGLGLGAGIAAVLYFAQATGQERLP